MSWKDFLANPGDRLFHRRLRKLCEGREVLSDAGYYHRFFADTTTTRGMPVAENTVTQVRNLFVLKFGKIFYLIEPDDDWSKKFRGLWDLDSLADVELVTEMEELFGIELSEAEAMTMVSLRKTVMLITEKLPPPDDVDV